MKRQRVRPNMARILIACALLAFILGFAIFFSQGVRRLAGGVAARLTLGTQPIDILVIANNARGVAANDPLGLGTAAGQADVILLARIDPAAHRIYAITIPRDTLFAQPGWNDPVPKIKTLFFMGDQDSPPKGPQELAKAVAQLTGLPVDGYIAANFSGFERAVDLVGGITVDVKKRIYDPRHSGANFQPGIQHMNGKEALAFVRVRQNIAGNSYRINDFQRMQAEVQVLGILRNTLLDPTRAATLIPHFVKAIHGDIATDLPQARLIQIGIAMAGAPVYQVPLGSIDDSMTLAPASVPGINAEGYLDGADYDVLDPAEIARRLAQFGATTPSLGIDFPPHADVHVTLYGSAHMALHFEHLGFQVTRVGAATGAQRVIYPAGEPAAGWEAARALGGGDVTVEPGGGTTVVVEE
ncbi:MAG: LCP family protein [Candidatus Baltobacteraceae bacterium]